MRADEHCPGDGALFALVYSQIQEHPYAGVLISEADADDGFVYVSCSACRGTGLFLLPGDGPVPCNECKTAGRRVVIL